MSTTYKVSMYFYLRKGKEKKFCEYKYLSTDQKIMNPKQNKQIDVEMKSRYYTRMLLTFYFYNLQLSKIFA